jgi:hypothetical protein
MSKKVILGTSAEFLHKEGLGTTPAIWEDGLRIDTGPGNFEWWYFDAQFDDGTTAVIVFATKPFTNRTDPLTPQIQLTITRPGGEKLVSSPFYTQEDFSASRETCDVRMADSWVRGDLHRYQMHVHAREEDKEALCADLVFTGIVPAWRPGAGKNYYNPELTRFFGWLPAIPFGSVEGTLTYQGQTQVVKGSGYHDHNWGNVSLEDIIDHWYWGRAHIGEYTAIFVEMTSTRTYGYQKIPIFLLAKGSQILIGDGAPLSLQVEDLVTHPGKRTYPRELDFDWQDGESRAHLSLRAPQVIESVSLLYFLPPWQKTILHFFANPYYFRFRADLTLNVQLAGEQGIEKGQAIYEMMLLR